MIKTKLIITEIDSVDESINIFLEENNFRLIHSDIIYKDELNIKILITYNDETHSEASAKIRTEQISELEEAYSNLENNNQEITFQDLMGIIKCRRDDIYQRVAMHGGFTVLKRPGKSSIIIRKTEN